MYVYAFEEKNFSYFFSEFFFKKETDYVTFYSISSYFILFLAIYDYISITNSD